MKGAILFVLLCVVAVVSGDAATDAARETLAQIQHEIDDHKERLDNWKSEVKADDTDLAGLKSQTETFKHDIELLKIRIDAFKHCCSQFDGEISKIHQAVAGLEAQVEDAMSSVAETECFYQALLRKVKRNRVRMDWVKDHWTQVNKEIIHLRGIINEITQSITVITASVQENKGNVTEISSLLHTFQVSIRNVKKIMFLNTKNLHLISLEMQKNTFTLVQINKEIESVVSRVEWLENNLNTTTTNNEVIWEIIKKINVHVENINDLYDKSTLVIKDIKKVITNIDILVESIVNLHERNSATINDVEELVIKISSELKEFINIANKNKVDIAALSVKITNNNRFFKEQETEVSKIRVSVNSLIKWFKHVVSNHTQIRENEKLIREYEVRIDDIYRLLVSYNSSMEVVWLNYMKWLSGSQTRQQYVREEVEKIVTYLNERYRTAVNRLESYFRLVYIRLNKFFVKCLTAREKNINLTFEHVKELEIQIDSYINNITVVNEQVRKIDVRIRKYIQRITWNEINITRIHNETLKLERIVFEMEQTFIRRLNEVCANINITSTKIISIRDQITVDIKRLWERINELTILINSHNTEWHKLWVRIQVVKNLVVTVRSHIRDYAEHITNIENSVKINKEKLAQILVDIEKVNVVINKMVLSWNSQVTILHEKINVNVENIKQLDNYVRIEIHNKIKRLLVELDRVDIRIEKNKLELKKFRTDIDKFLADIDIWRVNVDKYFNEVKVKLHTTDVDILTIERRITDEFSRINVEITNIDNLIKKNEVSITRIRQNYKLLVNRVVNITKEINIFNEHVEKVIEVQISENDVRLIDIQNTVRDINLIFTTISEFVHKVIVVRVQKLGVCVSNIERLIDINTKTLVEYEKIVDSWKEVHNITHVEINDIERSITNIRDWVNRKIDIVDRLININARSLKEIDEWINVKINVIIRDINTKINEITTIYKSNKKDITRIKECIVSINSLIDKMESRVKEVEKYVDYVFVHEVKVNTKNIYDLSEKYKTIVEMYKIVKKYVREEIKLILESVKENIKKIDDRIEVNKKSITDITHIISINDRSVMEIIRKIALICDEITHWKQQIKLIDEWRKSVKIEINNRRSSIQKLMEIVLELQASIKENTGDITTINEEITKIERVISINKETLIDYKKQFELVSERVERNKKTITSIEHDINRITVQVDKNQVSIKEIHADIKRIKAQININIESIEEINQEIIRLNGLLLTRRTDFSEIYISIATFKQDVYRHHIKAVTISHLLKKLKVVVDDNVRQVDSFLSQTDTLNRLIEETTTSIKKIYEDIELIWKDITKNNNNYEKVWKQYESNSESIHLLHVLVHKQIALQLNNLHRFVKDTLLVNVNNNHDLVQYVVNAVNRVTISVERNVKLITVAEGNSERFEALWACLKTTTADFKSKSVDRNVDAVKRLFSDESIKHFVDTANDSL